MCAVRAMVIWSTSGIWLIVWCGSFRTRWFFFSSVQLSQRDRDRAQSTQFRVFRHPKSYRTSEPEKPNANIKAIASCDAYETYIEFRYACLYAHFMHILFRKIWKNKQTGDTIDTHTEDGGRRWKLKANQSLCCGVSLKLHSTNWWTIKIVSYQKQQTT